MQSLDFTPPPVHKHMAQVARAGLALCDKVFEQVRLSGAFQAARNLRKQGYGLDVALALVAGRI